ncbi:MAG: ABC transporter permease [Acidimicrobiia bacterium]|nr:ABC transporter permease [Acidimicrobiia bacterium]
MTDLSATGLEHISELEEPIVPNADADADAEGLAVVSKSPTQLAFRRFLRHRLAVACLGILVLLTLMVVFAPLTARYSEIEQVTDDSGAILRNVSPRWDAWFGTDDIGRDLYARIIWGGRVSMFIGIAVAFFSAIIGTAVGALAGWRGGRVDDALMRVTDIFLAFPLLVALLVMRNLFAEITWLRWLFGDLSSPRFIVVLLSLVGWMLVARLVRGTILSLKEREFVEAARALGATDRKIIMRHLIPNSLGPIIVAMTTTVAVAIITESTLSFFGYGPNPAEGRSSWGNLLREADGAITTGREWKAIFPGLTLVLVVLCVNFVGDGLRDAFDPKQRRTSG